MKKYSDLSEDQKQAAKDYQIHKICNYIATETIIVPHEDINNKIIIIMDEIVRLQTPWFLAEVLFADKDIREYISNLASAVCKDAFYCEADEDVIAISLLDELIDEKNEKV